jgi:TetR/AcrR family transcriptional regulator, regulator of cefoperazone and chloramphenicol sensitivity
MFDTPVQHSGPAADRESATRQRILDAAAEVFSERGFREATIREICSRAGTNLASVNYHFGDKEGLYREVLRYADTCAAAIKPIQEQLAAASGLDARAKVRLFIRGYIAAMVESGKLTWHNRLISREMVEPSPALDAIVTENIRPRSQMLDSLVRELLGPAADDGERVARCKLSIVGQCLMYHMGRHVIRHLHPEYSLTSDSIDRVAEHIAEFSLAAIDAMRAAAAPPKDGSR